MKNHFFSLLTTVLFVATLLSCKKTPEPTPDPVSVTDIDGNVYPVAKICGQFWMTENLKTTKYNDGTIIPTSLSNTAWEATTTGAYGIYNDASASNTTYGKLYNWYAANSTKLAPVGWHVATEAEWQALVTCLGGTTVAGGKMKATSVLWQAPNTGASNSSGFNALPSGFKGSSGSYGSLGAVAYFWGSNQRSTAQGEYLVLNNDFASVAFNGANKTFGYSVRCIKD